MCLLQGPCTWQGVCWCRWVGEERNHHSDHVLPRPRTWGGGAWWCRWVGEERNHSAHMLPRPCTWGGGACWCRWVGEEAYHFSGESEEEEEEEGRRKKKYIPECHWEAAEGRWEDRWNVEGECLRCVCTLVCRYWVCLSNCGVEVLWLGHGATSCVQIWAVPCAAGARPWLTLVARLTRPPVVLSSASRSYSTSSSSSSAWIPYRPCNSPSLTSDPPSLPSPPSLVFSTFLPSFLPSFLLVAVLMCSDVVPSF